jgi:hypothetical protein
VRSYKLVLLFASALVVLAIVGFVNAKGSSRAKATRQSQSCAALAAAARAEFGLSREALRLSSQVSQLLGEVAVAAWTQDAHRLNVDSALIATKQARLRTIASREAALERRFDGTARGCTPGSRTNR